MNHNSVPTTCTASLITGWDIPGVNEKDEKTRLKTWDRALASLISSGYKRDFAIIHVFTTGKQKVDDFLKAIGFEMVFHGSKADDESVQRHQETGDLFLWAIKPKDYQEGITKLKAEIKTRLEVIDPPKHPDPKRLAMPELKLRALQKAGFALENARVDNRFSDVVVGDPVVVAKFMKLTYGWDVVVFCKANNYPEWTRLTTRKLKDLHNQWRNELI
jgi:hypothetical protein